VEGRGNWRKLLREELLAKTERTKKTRLARSLESIGEQKKGIKVFGGKVEVNRPYARSWRERQ
jgi:hypothetical protein